MGSITVKNSDAPANNAAIGKIFSVPKGPAPGAVPTASGLQVRCAGRLRVHRCEPKHERLQMSSLPPSCCSPPCLGNRLTSSAPYF